MAPNASIGGVITTVISHEKEIVGLIGLLEKLFSLLHRPKPPNPAPVAPPVPVVGGGNETRLPDDDPIAVPVQKVVVPFTVHARLQKVQFSRALFPEMYTKSGNPKGWEFGLASAELLKEYESGNTALSRDSKIWHDLTARTADGVELDGEAIVRQGLAYKTEHHAFTEAGSETFIVGNGVAGTRVDGNGNTVPAPAPGYKTQDEGVVGNGITAWINSFGFNQQFKVGEGNVRLTGSVGGVQANELHIRVS